MKLDDLASYNINDGLLLQPVRAQQECHIHYYSTLGLMRCHTFLEVNDRFSVISLRYAQAICDINRDPTIEIFIISDNRPPTATVKVPFNQGSQLVEHNRALHAQTTHCNDTTSI